MNAIVVEVSVVAVLILVNALFAMSEMAVVSSRKVRLEQRAEEGDRGAQMALELANSPSQFLSTVQVGITLIGILAGAFGGATLAEELAGLLSRISALVPYSEAMAVGIVVLVITYFSLVIGELVPKRLALSDPERAASTLGPWMRSLSGVAAPVVSLLSVSTDAVLRVLPVRLASELPVTEEEVKLLIEQGTQAGVFEPTEQQMIGRVFRLADRTIEALMTPRPEVVWLEVNKTPEQICDAISASTHSCFPVAQDTLDNVLGTVLARDILLQKLCGPPIDIRAALHPALFVPERMSALGALERLKDSGAPMALVIDEYGGFQGLVTLTDLLEAIVGDIPVLEEGFEPSALRREDGSWLLDGRLPVDEFTELLHLEQLPEQEAGNYQTLGGFVMTSLGRIPSSGDHFEWGGIRFEVIDMDGRRVDKVLATPIQSGSAEVSP